MLLTKVTGEMTWLNRRSSSCTNFGHSIFITCHTFAELAKWPALELTAGGLGGWLLGSALGRR